MTSHNKHYDVTLEKLPKNPERIIRGKAIPPRDEWMVYQDREIIGFISHWENRRWHAMDAHGKTLGPLPRSKNAAILNVKLASLAK